MRGEAMSETKYDGLEYRELQEAAKARDLSAGGSAEDVKARLLEADAAEQAAAEPDAAEPDALTPAQKAGLPVDVQSGAHQARTYTPAEAVAASVDLAHKWARPAAAAE
jgi:hypothetical protein